MSDVKVSDGPIELKSGADLDAEPASPSTNPDGLAFREEQDLPDRDRLGHEMGENARVWRAYVDEATEADVEEIDGWNRSVDILLVFGGLFSAILTAFIIESYKLLQADYTEYTASLLLEIIRLQRGLPPDETLAELSPDHFVPSRLAIAVNALWFASLCCSLAATFCGMLVKQWLEAYPTKTVGSLRFRARLRQYHHNGLIKWYLPAIVASLPTLLHFALILFFAGLIPLIWQHHHGVGAVILALALPTGIFYVGTTILPLFDPQCPFKTPLTHRVRQLLQKSTHAMHAFNSSRRQRSPTHAPPSWLWSFSRRRTRRGDMETARGTRSMVPFDATREKAAANAVHATGDSLDAQAILWLVSTSQREETIDRALQSLAGLRRDFADSEVFREAGLVPIILKRFHGVFPGDPDNPMPMTSRLLPTHPHTAELYGRALMRLVRGTDLAQSTKINVVHGIELLRTSTNPDVAISSFCSLCQTFPESISLNFLLATLADCLEGEFTVSPFTLGFLVDTILETAYSSKSTSDISQYGDSPTSLGQNASNPEYAVKLFIRLLYRVRSSPPSSVCLGAGIALAFFVHGSTAIDAVAYRSEEKRRADYHHITIDALITLCESPALFSLDQDLLNLAGQELARTSLQLEEHPATALTQTAQQSATRILLHSWVRGSVTLREPALVHLFRLIPKFPHLLNEVPQDALASAAVRALKAFNEEGAYRILPMLSRQFAWSAEGIKTLVKAGGLTAIFKHVKSRLSHAYEAFAILHQIATTAYELHVRGDAEAPELLDRLFEAEFIESGVQALNEAEPTILAANILRWSQCLLLICRTRPGHYRWQNLAMNYLVKLGSRGIEGWHIDTVRNFDEMKKIARCWDISNTTGRAI